MPAGATYEPIATTTLASPTTTITLSSIPATYTDIRAIWVGNCATSGGALTVQLNGATTNYSVTNIHGNGTTAASNRRTTDSFMYIGYTQNLSTTANQVAMAIVDVFSYAGSTNKTILGQMSNDKNGTGEVVRTVGLYRSTSAITSITFGNDNTQNFSTGTTLTLYGIKAA